MKTVIIIITVISLILFSSELPIVENDVVSKERQQYSKHNAYEDVIQYYLSSFEYEEHIPKSTAIHKLRYFENTVRKILLIYFTPSPKNVIVDKEVTNDKRWKSLSISFSSLKEKIENGDDLTPYLSLKAQEKGYTPAASGTGPDTDKWADKDFLLNVMGFYHLHVGEKKEGKKIVGRTDDVVFAKVDRKQFTVIGVFDHSVFDKTDAFTQEMSSERKRLWGIFDKHTLQGISANSVVIPSMITTSAHNLKIVRLAQEYVRIIKEFDTKLDDRAYANSLYDETDISPPKNPKLDWHLRGTDIGVADGATNLYIVYKYGVN